MDVVTRVAVRILLLDPRSRVLLFEGRDLSDPSDELRFWFTAGGRVEPGEGLLHAAQRELQEETGLGDLTVVGPWYRCENDFLNHGEPTHQIEHYFAARSRETQLDTGGWTALEQRAVTGWRWWSAEELASTSVRYFPESLPTLLSMADRHV